MPSRSTQTLLQVVLVLLMPVLAIGGTKLFFHSSSDKLLLFSPTAVHLLKVDASCYAYHLYGCEIFASINPSLTISTS